VASRQPSTWMMRVKIHGNSALPRLVPASTMPSASPRRVTNQRDTATTQIARPAPERPIPIQNRVQ